MFARLVGHHPRIMFCLIVFSFAILLCFLLQYSCTIFSSSLAGFKPFFPLFSFSGFFQLPNHVLPEFHVSSDGLKEREVQLGFTAVSTGRFFLITNSFGHSFLQGVFLLTACSSCCTHWKLPKMVKMLTSSYRGFATKFFKIQTLRTATRYSET